MEVKSKKLHTNTLPVISVMLVTLVFSALVATAPGLILSKALVTQAMHVSPGANGLAHVSFEPASEDLGLTGQQTGKLARLSMVLQSISNDTAQ